jgi:hypothetical protein
MQIFASTIKAPSLLPDLRDSPYRSTQPLLTQRPLHHQSVKPYSLFFKRMKIKG